jgi:branched-chain amino acid transport system substrate-binding protein
MVNKKVNKKVKVIAAAAAAVLVLGACSSSKSSSNASAGSTSPAGSSASGGSSGGHTINVGVLTDLTGAAASGNKTFINGINAGVVLAKGDGYTIKYVTADTATSPAAALTAAQKLVTQDHVLVVVAQSAIAFAAAPYLNSHHVPVIGVAEDASEWGTDTNMFPIGGALHINAVSTTFGQLLKLLGATTLGTLGYGISPSSADSALGATKSAQLAGLKSGYVNANFPFGSTNVQPVAIAMKSAGVNAFYASVDPNTGFALITALRQSGDDLKAAVLPDGYGADTLQAGPGALQAAQNVYFTLGYEPVEMNTSATKQFQADLATSGTTGVPTYSEYNGYVAVGLLVQGLKAAGANPTQASLTTALSKIHNWNALGLWGGRTIDINNRTDILTSTLCTYVTKLVGSNFQLVSGAEPLCGSNVAGVTVGSSS